MKKYEFLDEYKIPYRIELTDRFVNHIMRIAECKPFFDEQLGTKLELSLVRRSKVRAVTYSNQIEGNPLTENEVTAILDGKKIAGNQTAILEIKNYTQALAYAEELANDTRLLRVADFCDLQKLVTTGLVPEQQCGRVRTVPVSIVNDVTKQVIQTCPPPLALNDLLEDLWQWLADTVGQNPFARAFAFHFIAVSIHPFVDGNGRSVRLMQHLLLLKSGQNLARFVPSETAIMRSRERYYLALQNCRSLQSLHPILEFLAECFADSAEQSVQEARSEFKESVQQTARTRHQNILLFAKSNSLFSIGDLQKELPHIPRRTLERDLQTLVQKKLLLAEGEQRGRTYTLRPTTKKKTKKRK